MRHLRLFKLTLPLIVLVSGVMSWAEQENQTDRQMQTVLTSTRCEGTVDGAWNSTTRIRVHLRNISPIEQPVVVTLQDIRYGASVSFKDQATAATNLTTWLNDMVNWRNIGGALDNQTIFNGVLAPNGHDEPTVSIQCMYSVAGVWSDNKCKLVAAELPSPGELKDAKYIVGDHSFSVKLTVKKPQGAVLASVFIQNVCVGKNISYTVTDSFPINGGRPF